MIALLLRIYPPAWRERYGAELVTLIEDEAGGRRIPGRIVRDLISAGCRQRLRTSGLLGDEVPPAARVRAGVLLVLSSWAGFVVAGLGFAKTAEHWQAVTPRPGRGVPMSAYDAVLLAAEVGTLAVVLGIVLTGRSLRAFLGGGGWEKIHRPVLRAIASTGLTLAVLLGVVAWAHQLTNTQRNGGDRLYTAVFLLLVACGVLSIALWTNAAVLTARELALSRTALRWETFLAGTSTVTMAVMTVSAAVWWGSVYGAPLRMVCMTFVMVAATVLGTAGTVRSVRALRA
jgi:hypothetical protein